MHTLISGSGDSLERENARTLHKDHSICPLVTVQSIIIVITVIIIIIFPFNFVQDDGDVGFGSPAIFCMDATWWPGGGEVVGNQEFHPAVWPVACSLGLVPA